MNQIYHILLVEDKPEDAELNKREIKKALPYCEFEVVDTKKEYLHQLKQHLPDIIISDYNLPSFDGLSALKIAQDISPLTPFIMVTGSINEDTAVECMKAGATDYVLKDSLKRLGSSVINALEQSRIKRERAEAFETIKLNEAKYRYMFHNNPQPMWIIDIETSNFLEVNEAAINHYGYSKHEFLSMGLKDICLELGMDNLHQENQSSKSTLCQAGQWVHKKKNGELILTEIISYSIIFNRHNALHLLINDITERKKAEEKLVKERKMLRTLIDNLPVSIYVKDVECRKIIANRADLDIIGVISEKEIVGKTDLEIYKNEIGKRGYADDKKVIATGEAVVNREEYFYDNNGNQKWLVTTKIPLNDENGKNVGLVGIGRDITEFKLAQEKISKLSKGIEQSSSNIVITDLKGNIEYANPAFYVTTGYTESEVLGQNPRIMKSGQMDDAVYKELWQTISAGDVWRGELLNKKKNGSLYWEWATITSIKNDKGKTTNYIAIKDDITERKRMQTELLQAKEKAEESDRLKSAFLANMSHEIRTPLNSIIGFSELLNDPEFDQEQKNEFIRTIIENGNSLLSIISDIMDFSMLEAHQMKIQKQVISTKKLFTDLRNDFSKKAIQKGIEFRVDQNTGSNDILIESDFYRIKQIFNNLIGNALKFTESGYVEIGYQLGDFDVIFYVKDTGIGIDPAHHQSIFERFRQIDLAKTRKYGGNGLGLSISKNLTELLGGRIWIESEPGKYSNFFFTIPYKKQ